MRHTRNKAKRGDPGMKPSFVALFCLISFTIGANFRVPLDCFPSPSSNDAPLHSTPLHSTPLHSTPLHSTPISEKEPKTSIVDKHSSRSKNQRSKNLLQIGANDGVKDNVDFVKNILNDPESKAVLVEGSPQIFQLLTQNVKTMYDQTQKRIVPVNAMVCEDGKQMTFYSPNIDKIKETTTPQNVQIPHWVRHQLGSLEKTSVIKGLRGWLKRQVSSELRPADFVQEESIHCISLASIIAQSSMAADEIGVLAIDVEGFDAPVMLESFKVPGLEPDKVVFEHKSTTTFFPEEFNAVMETLEARGYKFNCQRDPNAAGGWKCTGGQDVHAVKEVAS